MRLWNQFLFSLAFANSNAKSSSAGRGSIVFVTIRFGMSKSLLFPYLSERLILLRRLLLTGVMAWCMRCGLWLGLTSFASLRHHRTKIDFLHEDTVCLVFWFGSPSFLILSVLSRDTLPEAQPILVTRKQQVVYALITLNISGYYC